VVVDGAPQVMQPPGDADHTEAESRDGGDEVGAGRVHEGSSLRQPDSMSLLASAPREMTSKARDAVMSSEARKQRRYRGPILQ
jgi:hypothetical protein